MDRRSPYSGHRGSANAIQSLLPGIIDQLDLAIALFDPDGRELHRSPRLSALLDHHPHAERLNSYMGATVDETLALRRRRATTDAHDDSPVAGWRDVTVGGEHYRMRAVVLPEATILLEVEPDVARMPTIAQLGAFGLTAREAEVATLLAVGASDREIAQRLDISPHTARKHAEHIFGKLGVHTRKAFLLTLNRNAK